MPHQLSITDGTTTISLTSSNCILNHYVPQSPRKAGPGLLDYEDVTEPIEVTFTGASGAATAGKMNDVENLLLIAAQRFELGVGPKVYLQYQPIGYAAAWRSEIRYGDVQLGERAMTTFGQAVLETRIILTRGPWFEGSRTQIPLTDANGTNNTAGLTIYNHDDGGAGHDNYASIGAGVVGGTLPAPLEIHLQNTSGGSRGYSNFYLANNRFAPTMTHVLEGEARVSGGTVQSGSGYSNGQYVQLTGTSFEAQWNVAAATLAGARGRYVRVLGRVPINLNDPTWLQLQLRDYYGLVPLATGQEVQINDAQNNLLQDLGTIALPPGGDNSDWAQMRLVVKGRCAISATVGIDFLQLFPADPLCWRDIPQRAMAVANNDWVVDDGIEGSTYLIEGGNNHPIFAPIGKPLHVFPDVAQRLYVLTDGTSYSVDWTMKIKAYYRPRRLTI